MSQYGSESPTPNCNPRNAKQRLPFCPSLPINDAHKTAGDHDDEVGPATYF